MINVSKHRDNLYMYLHERDIITKLGSAITNRSAYRVPWVYTKYIYEANCLAYHNIYHRQLKRIHSFCRDCWKVVARPRNLSQHFDLYEYQRQCGEPCKLGLEVRETVHGLWGGYFYNRGKEEGLKRYEEVRKWADSVDKEIPVILKRYCTEFEIGPLSLGPSDQLPEQTEEEKKEETWIDGHLRLTPTPQNLVQPEFIQVHVMRKWIHAAYQWGDPTYKEFTGGSPLFPPYVTYHQEARNGKSISKRRV